MLNLNRNVIAQTRCFAKWQKPTNDFLDPEFIAKQKEIFEKTLSDREKAFAKADRLALLSIKKDVVNDENMWWNKIKTMNADELDLLPLSFLKKYGTFLHSIEDHTLMMT